MLWRLLVFFLSPVVPLCIFQLFFFSSAFFGCVLGKKLDFFSSRSPLCRFSLSLPRRHKHATTTEDILYTRARIKREKN